MPTVEDLGKLVKAKYPEYASMSDAEVGTRVKAKYPEYSNFTDVKSTFDKMPLREKALANLRSEASGESKARYEQAVGSAQKDINVAAEKTAATAAALPFLADALPGAASLKKVPFVGKAITAAEALSSRLVYENVKTMLGSDEKGLEGKALAISLGTDIATAEALESQTLKNVAKAAWSGSSGIVKNIALRAMAESSDGMKLIRSMLFDRTQQLFKLIANKRSYVQTGPMVKEALNLLEELPKAAGKAGKQATKMTEAAATYATKFAEDLKFSGAGVSLHQPVDGLIRMKRTIQDTAYQEAAGFKQDEREIFKRLTADFDTAIVKHLKFVGGDAVDLYKGTDRIYTAVKRHDQLVEMATDHLSGLLIKGTKKFTGWALTGISELALRITAEHPEAFRLLKQASEEKLKGLNTLSGNTLRRAFVMSGAMEAVRKFVEAGEGN